MEALRVLVAEDEASVAAALEAQLRSLGCEVVGEAATGRGAVELAAKVRPEVVLMDIKMPDMDGIEAARMIAEQCPVPVVFLSGHFSDELLEEVISVGGMAYLLKPASAEQLQAAFNLARKRFAEMRDLRSQVDKLKEALEARKLITRAKGLLMARHGIGEEEAHRRMQKEASRSNTKLVDLARAILAAGAFVGGKETGAVSRQPASGGRSPVTAMRKTKPKVATRARPKPTGGRPGRATGARPAKAGKLRGKTAKPARPRMAKKAPPAPPPVVVVGDVVRLLTGARNLIGRYDPLLARTAPGYREIKGIVCAIREIASGKQVLKTKGSLTAYVLEILHDLTFDGQFSSAQNIGGARGTAEGARNPAWQRVRGLVREMAGRGSEMRPAALMLENEDFKRSLDGWRVAKVKADSVAVER